MRIDEAVDIRFNDIGALRAIKDGVVVWEPSATEGPTGYSDTYNDTYEDEGAGGSTLPTTLPFTLA